MERGVGAWLSRQAEARLRSLGYLTSGEIADEDLGKDGVTLNLEGRASPGVNVYCTESSSEVKLTDLDGDLLHRIRVDVRDPAKKSNLCKTVGFDARGDMVMLVENTALIKTDPGGRVLWELRGGFHHDLDVMPDGTVYALHGTFDDTFAFLDPKKTIHDNQIIRVSPAGEIERRISLAELVRSAPELLTRTKKNMQNPRFEPGTERSFVRKDVFHANAVAVIRADVTVQSKLLFEEGQLLVGSRYLDAAMVVDPKRERIVWHWGPGELEWPHSPSLLEDGTLLVFDNGVGRDRSRVVWMSPASGRVLRTYEGTPPDSFFTRTRGSVQRLENGNWLICESEKGHAFEVDGRGEIVWEFWNPDRNEDGTERATIFELRRLPRRALPFLASTSEEP